MDPLSRRRFWDLIYDMARRGRTVFITTHYMEEAEYCDRVAMIYRGRMIALGTPRELKTGLVEEIILDLRCPEPQGLMDALSTIAGIRDVALFGAGLHLKVRRRGSRSTAHSSADRQPGPFGRHHGAHRAHHGRCLCLPD